MSLACQCQTVTNLRALVIQNRSKYIVAKHSFIHLYSIANNHTLYMSLKILPNLATCAECAAELHHLTWTNGAVSK